MDQMWSVTRLEVSVNNPLRPGGAPPTANRECAGLVYAAGPALSIRHPAGEIPEIVHAISLHVR